MAFAISSRLSTPGFRPSALIASLTLSSAGSLAVGEARVRRTLLTFAASGRDSFNGFFGTRVSFSEASGFSRPLRKAARVLSTTTMEDASAATACSRGKNQPSAGAIGHKPNLGLFGFAVVDFGLSGGAVGWVAASTLEFAPNRLSESKSVANRHVGDDIGVVALRGESWGCSPVFSTLILSVQRSLSA